VVVSQVSEPARLRKVRIALLSFRPAGEIFQGAGTIRTNQDSSLLPE